MASRKILAFVSLFAAFLLSAPALAVFQVFENPSTNIQVTVWSSTTQGQTTVYISRLIDNFWTESESFVPTACVETTIAIASLPSGDVSVAWGTNETTGRVLMRTFLSADGLWGPEVTVSYSSEPSGGPSILPDAGGVLVAYETTGPRAVKLGKFDSGGSVERSLVAECSSGGTGLSARLHSEQSHVWIDWIESPGSMGFSQRVAGSWQEPVYELLSGSEDAEAARGRVRTRVMQN